MKFAIVREDPRLEEALIDRFALKSPLVVASGGCTALTLATRSGVERVTAFDLNPAQLAHLTRKREAADRGDLEGLAALERSGAFEALFRVLRRFVEELVTPELPAFFGGGDRRAIVARMVASPYWPAAFATTFNEPFLHAMFGPAATQHAAPGSYPPYFQRVFERGLSRDDAADNPFLQHVFLDRPRTPPAWAARPIVAPIDLVQGTLLDVPALERFDLLSLSNVFDWSDDALVSAWSSAIVRAARPGAVVLLRQLNNRRDLRSFFAPAFTFDGALGRALCDGDRSLFYERVEVGVRV
ncbi:MAG: DUF3419 family protein [Deltaproteobacteria bacterium]|nr:DUF3419 family protein [Deltaproteobacteria bacterium]